MRYLLLLFLLSYAVPTYAGTFGTQDVDSSVDWKHKCSKPHKPSFTVSDVDSYNSAVEDFNAYVLEIESYINCVNREANSDAQDLANAVQKGSQRAVDDVSSDLESAKSDLERHRSIIK